MDEIGFYFGIWIFFFVILAMVGLFSILARRR
jgi:hypothetical protein